MPAPVLPTGAALVQTPGEHLSAHAVSFLRQVGPHSGVDDPSTQLGPGPTGSRPNDWASFSKAGSKSRQPIMLEITSSGWARSAWPISWAMSLFRRSGLWSSLTMTIRLPLPNEISAAENPPASPLVSCVTCSLHHCLNAESGTIVMPR